MTARYEMAEPTKAELIALEAEICRMWLSAR